MRQDTVIRKSRGRARSKGYIGACFLSKLGSCKGIIEVHHRNGNPLNNTLRNLVSLCQTHHRLVENGKIDLSNPVMPSFRLDQSGKRRYGKTETPLDPSKVTEVSKNHKEKIIQITCEGTDMVRLKDLIPLQGKLKSLSKDDFQRCLRSMQQYGFSFPFFIWVNKKKTYLENGHQRLRVLKQIAKEKWNLPSKFPAVRIHAKDRKEAGEKILLESSQYGRMDNGTVRAFGSQNGLDLAALESVLELPQINFEKFKADLNITLSSPSGNHKPVFNRKLQTALISDLHPHPRNYRKHPDDQLEHLMQSIEEFGLYRSIITARDMTILSGHGLVEAAKKMAVKKISIIRLDLDPNEPRALKILVGDNELEHLAEIDDRGLSEILKELKDAISLIGTGYDETMLANLVFVTRNRDEIKDFDKACHWVGMPDYDPGEDVIQMKVNFLNEKDRNRFLKKINMDVKDTTQFAGGRRLSFWWPLKNQTDLTSVKFKAMK